MASLIYVRTARDLEETLRNLFHLLHLSLSLVLEQSRRLSDAFFGLSNPLNINLKIEIF